MNRTALRPQPKRGLRVFLTASWMSWMGRKCEIFIPQRLNNMRIISEWNRKRGILSIFVGCSQSRWGTVNILHYDTTDLFFISILQPLGLPIPSPYY